LLGPHGDLKQTMRNGAVRTDDWLRYPEGLCALAELAAPKAARASAVTATRQEAAFMMRTPLS
jgi:hypothetical protein